MTLRISEIFTSIQGEGPKVGEPTTFIRFAGCNLRCPGWPCDSYFAIKPEYYVKGEWEDLYYTDVLARLPKEPRNVCLTGGEPLIQHSECLQALMDGLKVAHHTVEIFTNGTKVLPSRNHVYYTAVIDWKLPGSGEYDKFNFENLGLITQTDSIKFVISDEEDWRIARDLIEKHDLIRRCQVFVGTAWGKLSEGLLVGWILKDLPRVRLNTQIHKYIWDPNERRR